MKRRVHEAPDSTKSDSAARRETVLGRLAAVGPDGDPWIALSGAKAKAQPARTTVALGPSQVGREVLVCFAGKENTPVVVGLVAEPGDQPSAADGPSVDLTIDRQRIILDARQEIVLRCGKARIRLTADGKVEVHGADVVSSARRTNRIRGGTVKIN